MNDHQLLRYSRQIMLPQVDIAGQQTLLNAKVLIIGAGGLGSPAAMYLAAAGVGRITLYDDDHVELTNLQRQIAHGTADIGINKAVSSQSTLQHINPEVDVIARNVRLQGETLNAEVAGADVVLDCSDNFASRFAINRACVENGTPLVSGAAIRFEGQISVFTPGHNDSPCYNCLYQSEGEELQNCARNGVIAPITGIVGSVQALEAMKLLMDVGESLVGRLLILDGLTMEWQTLRLKRNPACPTCGRSNT
ncbi:MAG: molybdopterin-synthase adenylyltransferase MoeB [Methylomonas sp.]|nr:molybdopterin-synthase adenylyltransferase MoeB [Methylomonas sp.]PPD20339.1 MAG: molybdopterin-synthase adenylyltransferase MoeB [Methylomonas sp.]PPD26616.1 MAG: molybdopterin-synthase adenylyltransferase MoeB [Methylomonas sp.]PPD38404.1 MAG: molybdopterin-synthase adenylyltransferase MoeB [Methylomonas sp.]PPD40440.1 MAG: molybdopterin-synthase adenylyltransferase MoeB [Methylomonas sp.]